jgi:hypothetical protein
MPKAGLYESRLDIEDRYTRQVGNDYLGHKSVADALLQQKREIDKEYARFMLEVERNPTCCASVPQDPIEKHVCALALYRPNKNAAVADFLKDVPDDKESAAALMVMDEIAYGTNERNSTGLAFGPYGPVTNYLTDLFRLASAGDKEALRKFLGLYAFATGEYAEALEDDAEKLFLEHSRIVVLNWQLIRTHTDLLPDLSNMMSRDQKVEARSQIKRQCSLLHRKCDEILASLK